MKRLTLALIAGLTLTFLGWSCTPAPGGSSTLTVSKSSAAPGEYVTLEHNGITAGLPVIVEFTAPGGPAVRVESFDVEDGRVRVSVPPFVDFPTATIGPGDVTLSIPGIDSQASLHIDDLPILDDVEPGAVLRLFLLAAIEDYQSALADLTVIETEIGQNDSSSLVSGLDEQIDQLQAVLTELESTGQLVVNVGSLGVTTLTAVELRTADRLLASMLVRAADSDPAASKGAAAHRELHECYGITLPGQPPPQPLPPGVSPADCALEIVSEGIRAIRDSAAPALEAGGRIVTGAGIIVTGVAATTALVATSIVTAPAVGAAAGTLALTGTLVSVIGGAASFAGAAIQGKNTDQWIQETGEAFNPGLEILSQLARVLISATSTGFESLENGFTTFTTWFDRFVTGMDAYVGLSCSTEESQKSIRPRAVSIAFCSVVRPAGCDNSCVTAFDGVCDDGGPDAPRSGCTLGTDCVDCGPRDETTSGGDQLCTEVCLFPSDGECDDGGPGSVTSFCSYGADCTDCGPRDPLDEPTGDEEGACCIAGNCSMQNFNTCAISGGDYLGEGSTCASATCESDTPAVEYVIWYTANVSCWSAPLMYITDRAGFEREEIASSYPGGGIDPTYPLEKAELQGGFASVEEARVWICPQFVSRFSHAWCSSYYQTANCNWQPDSLGCDLSALPFTDTLPAGTSCP